MNLMFATKRLRVAVSTGIADDEDDLEYVRSTHGDFDVAESDDEEVEDFAFGFQGGTRG